MIHCKYFDFNNCLHPSVYKDKSKIPTKTGDGGILCPLGGGVIPRWCPLEKGIMPKENKKKGKEKKHSKTMLPGHYPLISEETKFWFWIALASLTFLISLIALARLGLL